MKNDNAKFKTEFKRRVYTWVLRLIKFIDSLPKNTICDTIGKQLLRSGTSVLANYVEANSASSKKDFKISMALVGSQSPHTNISIATKFSSVQLCHVP